jgi:hypothetical protein
VPFFQAQAKRAKEDKEVKHEKELWRSEGRKEIIAAEQAALKQYEKQLIEEARIKSEQFRVVSVTHKRFCAVTPPLPLHVLQTQLIVSTTRISLLYHRPASRTDLHIFF